MKFNQAAYNLGVKHCKMNFVPLDNKMGMPWEYLQGYADQINKQ